MEIEVQQSKPVAVSELGPLVAEYQASSSAYVRGIIFSILLGLFGLLIALLGFALMRKNIAKGQWGENFRILIFGGVLIVWAIRRWLNARKLLELRILAFRDGVARMDGTIAQTARWDEVNVVWRYQRTITERYRQGQPQAATQFVLQLADDRRIEFDDSIMQHEELRKYVEAKTLAFLLPIALDAIRGGANLSFGPISASSEGIHNKDEVLPWGDLKSIENNNGSISVRSLLTTVPFCKLKISEVPNPHLLFGLVSKLSGQGNSEL